MQFVMLAAFATEFSVCWIQFSRGSNVTPRYFVCCTHGIGSSKSSMSWFVDIFLLLVNSIAELLEVLTLILHLENHSSISVAAVWRRVVMNLACVDLVRTAVSSAYWANSVFSVFGKSLVYIENRAGDSRLP